MSLMINDECIACAACVAECPTQAITEGDPTYAINTEMCVECVDYFDSSQCASVCPVDACVPDPDHKESKEELLAKKEKLAAS